jgi:hypothetical protein
VIRGADRKFLVGTSLRDWLYQRRFPQFIKSTTTNVSTNTASATINIGSPTAGQLVVVCARQAGGSSSLTMPGGWSTIEGNNGDASDDAVIIGYRACDGSEGATITITSGGSSRWAAVALTFTGAGTPTKGQVQFRFLATANPITDPTHISWGVKDYCFVNFATWDGDATLSSAPTGYENSGSIANTGATGTGRASVGWAMKFSRASRDVVGAWTISASNNTMNQGIAIPPG